jgi:hypothetical protein
MLVCSQEGEWDLAPCERISREEHDITIWINDVRYDTLMAN